MITASAAFIAILEDAIARYPDDAGAVLKRAELLAILRAYEADMQRQLDALGSDDRQSTG